MQSFYLSLEYDLKMTFEIIGNISHVETFAESHGIRQLNLLNNLYGKGKWKKRKGFADIKLKNGNIRKAELH